MQSNSTFGAQIGDHSTMDFHVLGHSGEHVDQMRDLRLTGAGQRPLDHCLGSFGAVGLRLLTQNSDLSTVDAHIPGQLGIGSPTKGTSRTCGGMAGHRPGAEPATFSTWPGAATKMIDAQTAHRRPEATSFTEDGNPKAGWLRKHRMVPSPSRAGLVCPGFIAQPCSCDGLFIRQFWLTGHSAACREGPGDLHT